MGTENQGTIERWEDDLRIRGKVCISRPDPIILFMLEC